MTREALPLLGSFDPFGSGIEPWLIRWIANSAGVWLQVDDNYGNQGPLSMREVEGMSRFNPDELEVSHVDGVGYCYGLPGGKPILPFPFTAEQLFEFDQRQDGLVRGNFYSGAEEAEAQLTELEQTNPEVAELARIIFSGVMPEQQATTPGPAPVVTETTEQRRARWLDWYGKGERGAVELVYRRELLTNPRADRSFIGKEINKAKLEKAKAIQGRTMFAQLVQDGKRKG